MLSKYKFSLVALVALLTSAIVFTGCTKAELDDEFPVGDPPPVAGGFKNSSEIASANLVAHFPFEGNIIDAKGGVTGGKASGTTSFVTGRKGQAYQGSTNGFIGYTNPGPIAGLTSFTVSMWINTGKHDGGAQGVFGLAKQDGSFWGNFFMMIEGNNSSDNRMFMKLHFEKIQHLSWSIGLSHLEISGPTICTMPGDMLPGLMMLQLQKFHFLLVVKKWPYHRVRMTVKLMAQVRH